MIGTLPRYIVNPNRIITVLLMGFTLIPACSEAQSRLTLTASDSLAFMCSLDGKAVSSTLLSSLTIPGIAAGKHQIKVTFSNGSSHEQLLTLKDKMHHSYLLSENKGIWMFVISSEANYQPAMLTGLAVAEDSTVVAETPEEDYDGVTGCAVPCSVPEFDMLKNELGNTFFEIKKLEKMKSFALTTCLRVDQLRFLLTQLEVEDNRLRLLEQAVNSIYDTSRLPLVLDDFFLEKNKERARAIISSPE
ncbi:MAG: DUF4476 domain-containing protein [Flavobacteriales bacterium]|jgi:hypothetical protein